MKCGEWFVVNGGVFVVCTEWREAGGQCLVEWFVAGSGC